MNKNSWELKKLGKVAIISAGQTAPKYDFDFGSQGFPFIRAGHLEKLISGENEYSLPKISLEKGIHYKLKLYPKGAILFAKSGMSATLNRIYKLQNDSYVVSHLAIVEPNKIYIISDFIKYFLMAYKPAKLIKDTAYPSISLSDIKEINIAIPSLSIQKKIVKELDTLSDIITKKKEQLAELDKLAQAIFYNMFGDPVENEKKWPIKKLNDVCIKITDGTHNSPKNSQEGDFPYITAKNIRKDRIDLRDLTYISKEEHKIIFNRCNPEKGDLLYIKDGATTGIAQINTLDFEFSLLSSVALLKPDFKQINSFYFKYFLNNKKVYDSIRRNMGGAAITRLTIKKIQAIILLLPPLSIQTQFAEKIEAIEQQKALINQSITDTQLLFDYTMDKYFN